MTPEVDRIKDACACNSVPEVNATARHFAAEVSELESQGGDMRTMAIQIKNLAAWKRADILRKEQRA